MASQAGRSRNGGVCVYLRTRDRRACDRGCLRDPLRRHGHVRRSRLLAPAIAGSSGQITGPAGDRHAGSFIRASPGERGRRADSPAMGAGGTGKREDHVDGREQDGPGGSSVRCGPARVVYLSVVARVRRRGGYRQRRDDPRRGTLHLYQRPGREDGPGTVRQ